MRRPGKKRFRDRADAGSQLGEKLAGLGVERPVVLALPRGGVPVGAEVARALSAPLNVLVVRKLGAPNHSELAVGAIAADASIADASAVGAIAADASVADASAADASVEGGAPEIILNRDVVRQLSIPQSYIDAECARQLQLIAERRRLYMMDDVAAPITDRVVIVVDDGMATGATMAVAVKALKKMDPRRIVAAVPVASDVAIELLGDMVDQLVCLSSPRIFGAVSSHYRDFHQLSDADVVAILAEERIRPA